MNLDTPILSLESQQITPARLAWIMDVGDRTVWEWNNDNLITRFKRGRIIRYAPESVIEFILRDTIRARLSEKLFVSNIPSPIEVLSAGVWRQIERLMADQMKAQIQQKETELTEKAA